IEKAEADHGRGGADHQARPHADGVARRGEALRRCGASPPSAGDRLGAGRGFPPGRGAATGMDRQTLRDWVHRYNEAGPPGLRACKPAGRPPKLTATQMTELRDLVMAGPDPKRHKVIRWRCIDLCGEVTRRFAVEVPERTISKWLRKLKLTRLQPRPHHPKKDAAVQAAFKKTSPPG